MDYSLRSACIVIFITVPKISLALLKKFLFTLNTAVVGTGAQFVCLSPLFFLPLLEVERVPPYDEFFG